MDDERSSRWSYGRVCLPPDTLISTADASYRITKVIGGGGTSLIYEATLGRQTVAIKEFYPVFCHRDTSVGDVVLEGDPAQLEPMREMFRVEGTLVSERLKSGLVCPAYLLEDVTVQRPGMAGFFSHTMYSVMQSLNESAVSLSGLTDIIMDNPNGVQALREGKMKVHTAALIIEQVLKAVSAVHASSLLYGDMNLGSIFFIGTDAKQADAIGTAVLVDFGCSRELQPDGKTAPIEPGTAYGTEGFIAPEAFSSMETRFTYAYDIYGIGSLFYCLLTGNPPKSGAADSGISEYELRRNNDCGKEAAQIVNTILKNALASAVEDRYTICDEMLSVIRHLVRKTENIRIVLLHDNEEVYREKLKDKRRPMLTDPKKNWRVNLLYEYAVQEKSWANRAASDNIPRDNFLEQCPKDTIAHDESSFCSLRLLPELDGVTQNNTIRNADMLYNKICDKADPCRAYCITGKSGSGKTTLLKYLCSRLNEQMNTAAVYLPAKSGRVFSVEDDPLLYALATESGYKNIGTWDELLHEMEQTLGAVHFGLDLVLDQMDQYEPDELQRIADSLRTLLSVSTVKISVKLILSSIVPPSFVLEKLREPYLALICKPVSENVRTLYVSDNQRLASILETPLLLTHYVSSSYAGDTEHFEGMRPHVNTAADVLYNHFVWVSGRHGGVDLSYEENLFVFQCVAGSIAAAMYKLNVKSIRLSFLLRLLRTDSLGLSFMNICRAYGSGYDNWAEAITILERAYILSSDERDNVFFSETMYQHFAYALYVHKLDEAEILGDAEDTPWGITLPDCVCGLRYGLLNKEIVEEYRSYVRFPGAGVNSKIRFHSLLSELIFYGNGFDYPTISPANVNNIDASKKWIRILYDTYDEAVKVRDLGSDWGIWSSSWYAIKLYRLENSIRSAPLSESLLPCFEKSPSELLGTLFGLVRNRIERPDVYFGLHDIYAQFLFSGFYPLVENGVYSARITTNGSILLPSEAGYADAAPADKLTLGALALKQLHLAEEKGNYVYAYNKEADWYQKGWLCFDENGAESFCEQMKVNLDTLDYARMFEWYYKNINEEFYNRGRVIWLLWKRWDQVFGSEDVQSLVTGGNTEREKQQSALRSVLNAFDDLPMDIASIVPPSKVQGIVSGLAFYGFILYETGDVRGAYQQFLRLWNVSISMGDTENWYYATVFYALGVCCGCSGMEEQVFSETYQINVAKVIAFAQKNYQKDAVLFKRISAGERLEAVGIVCIAPLEKMILDWSSGSADAVTPNV